ncbi:MAG TPA: LysR substrate-binding domain-containing protein [Solirubrobacteraceae bacterium]|nr:LysR substrate-binding domain-containing protein [Solirubrobacteraceae bacterium]
MELRQLRYFVAVAEELHFRRAAQRLHISQPPLTRQIAALEAELGCALLERSRRRVELTPAGEAFLAQARAMLAELDAAVGAARAIGSGQAGVLRIGFVGSALSSLVPAAVQRFRRARPGVEIQLRERSTVQALRALASGELDVGLVRPPIEPDAALEAEVVMRERTIAALPAGHELAALERVPLGRLAAQPLVMFPRRQAPGFHDLLIGRMAATGTTPRVVQQAPEMLTIIGLVAAGIGVSPVPESVAHVALDGVAYRPLIGAPDTELVAVWRRDAASPQAAAFVAQTRLAAGALRAAAGAAAHGRPSRSPSPAR